MLNCKWLGSIWPCQQTTLQANDSAGKAWFVNTAGVAFLAPLLPCSVASVAFSGGLRLSDLPRPLAGGCANSSDEELWLVMLGALGWPGWLPIVGGHGAGTEVETGKE